MNTNLEQSDPKHDSDVDSDMNKDDMDMFPKLDLFDKPDSSDEDIKARNRMANPAKKITIKVFFFNFRLSSTNWILSRMFTTLENYKRLQN
jgi:hypothetical protein